MNACFDELTTLTTGIRHYILSTVFLNALHVHHIGQAQSCARRLGQLCMRVTHACLYPNNLGDMHQRSRRPSIPAYTVQDIDVRLRL